MLLFRVRVLKDENAFAQLYQQYHDQIYRFCRAKLPTKADAQDAVAVTFMRAWNYLTNAVVEESFSGLLYTIARGVIAGFYQKRKKTEGMEDYADPIGGSKEQIEAGVELTFIKEQLATMKEDYAQVLIMRFFDGLSIREISKQLQKTDGATRVLLHRALKTLRSKL